MQCLVLLSTAKIQTIFRNGFILLGFCWCSRLEILLCAGFIVLSIRNANIVSEDKPSELGIITFIDRLSEKNRGGM